MALDLATYNQIGFLAAIFGYLQLVGVPVWSSTWEIGKHDLTKPKQIGFGIHIIRFGFKISGTRFITIKFGSIEYLI